MKYLNIKHIAFFFLLLPMFNIQAQEVNHQIDLSGQWRFAIDSTDKGITEKWYTKTLAETVQLPGSMATNGKGNEVTSTTVMTGQIVDKSYFTSPKYAKYRVPGNIKIPYWLQSVKYYLGAAWYQKEVIIPNDWKNSSLRLVLERCHWESKLWIDNQEVGMRNSLGTPHEYDLTDLKLTAGKHVITICVDNRVKDIDPGENSHSISDHTQTNWNGIVGKMYLEARPLVSINDIQIFPNIQLKKILAKIKINNFASKKQKATLTLFVNGASTCIDKKISMNINAGTDSLEVEYPIGDNMKLWSEFHPNMYALNAELNASKQTDTYQTTFGMREIKAVGKQLRINGKPLALRGTLECAIFPLTGFPPTDKAAWVRIYNIAKAHGLNHLRFHSWCPPAAAFDAADELGVYLQVECSSWANQSTTIGDGKPFDAYLYRESERMIKAHGNHPSFILMPYGNEPGGKKYTEFLTQFVKYWKQKDNRRLYTTAAGWPSVAENDYQNTPNPRIQLWKGGLKSIINASAPASDYDWNKIIEKFTQPVVSHEIGEWCVYPNFKEISKYTGVVRAKNFEIFQETLKDNGMEQLADSFLLASGKLQALCYKADIEAALRTKDFGGFQLLDLHDFPGQGTALVGVLDAFWNEKGYISPKEYSRFCNSAVPLARLKKHIYTNADTLSTAVEVAHYGDEPMMGCVPQWKVTDVAGKVLFTGKLPQIDIPLGNCTALGQITVPLSSVQKAEKLILEVAVGTFSNTWDIYVYPAKKEAIVGVEKIKVVSALDSLTMQYLEKGGSVLLSLKQGTLKPESGGSIEIGFSSIFWNTAWTKGQAPHTLGVLCNPNHPALASFPTEYHSNWQWWDAMSHSNAIILSSLPSKIKPIVRVIDDWFTNRPLALLFEVKVGNGKLMVSGIDFNTGMDTRPEAQQLLYSIKKYMTGKQFNPQVEVTKSEISKLLK